MWFLLPPSKTNSAQKEEMKEIPDPAHSAYKDKAVPGGLLVLTTLFAISFLPGVQ